jgi:CDP-paratose 2-epimerase
MSTAIVTGSGGLVGSETVRFLLKKGMDVIGIDNNMRQTFFGPKGSVEKMIGKLITLPWYLHSYLDIRDAKGILSLFEHQEDISLVVHCAAQPSHDWAAKEPVTDFTVNAWGTLNVLEAMRRYAPDAVFIFTSTNKVYGDGPNHLPYVARDTRYELAPSHPYAEHGIDETMSIDQSLHSVFGASKVAADIMVQEYGRYFGLKTGVFRGGCLTGPAHAGVVLHGFLSYLIKCVKEGRQYIVFGYDGKQVRDQIHSYDLVRAFWEFYQKPRPGEVYNIGGSRHSNCSVLEAIAMAEEICKKKLNCYSTLDNRVGDHRWWISDVRKFQSHYPDWKYRYTLREIMEEIAEGSPNGMEAGC